MSESQYAVFHFDVKTMAMRDAQGREPAGPLIFRGLDEAERYAEDKIATMPALGCRIYDHSGTAVRTFANNEIFQEHHGHPAAKRTLLIGGACYAIGAGSIALDAWFGFQLILRVLLGVRFFWAGTVKTAEGISGLMAERARRRSGAQ